MPTIDDYYAMMNPDPAQLRQQKIAALLQGLGTGLLSGRNWQQGAANAGLLGMQNVANVQPQMQADAMNKMKMQGFAQELSDKDRARQDDETYRSTLQNFQMPAPLPSMAPTPQNAAALQSTPKAGLYEQLLAKADAMDKAGLPQKAEAYRAMAEKYAPQYDGTETLMQNGKPVVMQRYKNRAPETLSGYQPKPEYKQVDTGGQVGFYDPLTGASGGQFGKTMTPGEIASNEVARGNLGLSRERLNFDKTQGTGKPQWDSASGQFVYPPSENAPAGRAVQPQGYTGKNNAGALASQKAIAAVDEADSLLNNATGSYVGAGVDQAARAFGSATTGAKTIAQLKVLESNIMMNQPRMEGPQSNMDVLMYRQAAGQIGDPTVPNEQKKAALDTIRKMHEKYAGITGAPRNAGATGVWSITPAK